LYAEQRLGGVPVVRIRTFSDHHIEYIRQFLDAASLYKDEPCLIVDIRGNGGGNTAYARQWVTRYTGQQPTMVQIFTELKSETSMIGRSNYFANLLDRYPELEDQGYQVKAEEFRRYAEEMEDTESYWTSYIVPEPKTISNNRTLIVLVDKNVGSAAEGFLSYIHQVENVILIGENSAGAVIYGQMTYHVLPHSKLHVYLPISLNVFVDLVHRETRGFYPDLWVPSGKALNYAVAAVRSGSIPTPQWYQEEIASTDFVPETVLESSGKGFDILDYIPVLFAVFYGGVLVYANRHRGSKVFFAGGILAFLLVLFFPFKQVFIGYAFLLVGLEYLGIALYKWRKRNRQKSHPVENQGADEYL